MHVVITGASRRIGLGLAEMFVKEGHQVSMQVRSQPDEFLTFRNSHHTQTHHVACDLLEDHALEDLYGRLCEKFGPADLLINNASNFEPDNAEDFEADQLASHIRVNLEASITLARDMSRDQGLNQGASIINIVDQRVDRLTPKFFTYTLAKSALRTATITMAQQFAPNIRVNAIGPGPTMVNKRQASEDFAAQVDALPLKRAISVEDLFATACFLSENPCITGQIIHVDSGQHLAWETPDVLNANE